MTLPRPYRNRKLTVENFIGIENGFTPISAGQSDKCKWRMHSAASLSSKNLSRMLETAKDGGTRDTWKRNPTLQIPAYEGRDDFFRDVYARMFWKKPAPTITTRFNSFSNGRFGHPTEDRAISLREGATLQTFPKRYRFVAKNKAAVARLIGNAVPPAMAQRIGRHLMKLTHGQI
jgi:DNA (cytosine-5)-methyltransferase 1